MSIVPILAITFVVLLMLGRMPGLVGRLAGVHQMTLALLLPVMATFCGVYAAFAVATVVLIVIAPGIGRGGLALPPAAAIELRARLFVFALPMLPILTLTIAISGLTLVQLTYVNLLSAGFLLAMLRAGLDWRAPSLARWDALVAVMLAVQVFMDARGNNVTFALRAALIVVIDLGLPYLAVSRACLRVRSPDAVMLSLVVAGCVLAVMAPVESIRHWLLYDTMPGLAHADPELMSGYTKERDGLLRAHVTYGESTGLSLLFGLLVVMLAGFRRKVGSRWVLTMLAGVLAMGLVFTFARVGYIVIGVGLVALFAYERKVRQLMILALALPAVTGLLLVVSRFVPAIAASLGTSDDAAGSVDYRSMLLDAGMQLIRENWLTGLDMKTILDRLSFLQTGEQIVDLVNQPLTIFMRAGVIGGCLYFAMFVAVLAALFARGPRLAAEARATGGACFAGLIGLMASLTTTSFGRNEITFVVLLAAGAGVLGRRAAVPVRSAQPRHQRDIEQVAAQPQPAA